MIARPVISVIVPVFNGAAFLGDAIRSVLAQNYHPLEIIVVDDGSTDNTAEAATSFGQDITYHFQENAGPPAARNQGLSMAGGDVIAFLDADDLFVPDKFAQQLARFNRTPELDVVIGRQVYESLDGRPVVAENSPERAEGLSLQLGCGLFRQRAFEKVGVFNAALKHSDDWDWFLRAREMGISMVIHRDLVLRQRVHENNLTRQRDEGAKYQRLAFKLSLDRRRANGGRAVSLPPLASYIEPEPGEALTGR